MRSGRNLVRDRVTLKEAFSLFLLNSAGGYTVDTNVVPMPDKFVHFPSYSTFYLPFVGDREGDEVERNRVDCWCMFNPLGNEKPKLMLDEFHKAWKDSEEIFAIGGVHDKYYHSKVAPIMITSIQKACKDGHFGTWEALTDNDDISREVKELNIIKYYFNTHVYEMTPSAAAAPNKLFGSIKNKPLPQIFVAIKDNTTSLLQMLLAEGANPNAKYTSKDANDETLLHYAARNNKHECVKILLASGNINVASTVKYRQLPKAITAYEVAIQLKNKKCCDVFEEYFKNQLHKGNGEAKRI